MRTDQSTGGLWLTTGRLVTGAAILALVAGLIGGVLGALVRGGLEGSRSRPAAFASSCDVTAAAARLLPSLVTINVGGPTSAGTGSGSVLDKEGNILTNDHVIAPGPTGGAITVKFARGQSGTPARVVGRDPSTDLAVIRVQGSSNSLTPIQIGDSAGLVVGQPVVAAGSPLGLNSTITSGIVSALSRYINVGQGERPSLLVNAIQTDASINPGNSGGPLTDCSGRQVGVNSAGAQVPTAEAAGGSIGLNFAIPIDFARSVASQIIQTGHATHPIIGVLGVSVTEEIARSAGLPRGALVDQVIPGLGAANAGIRPGDVITRIGSTGVNSVDQMIVEIRKHRVGDTLHVAYVRAGSTRIADVAISEA